MDYIKVTRSDSKKTILLPMSNILEIQDNLVIQEFRMQLDLIEIDETVDDIEKQILDRELLKRTK